MAGPAPQARPPPARLRRLTPGRLIAAALGAAAVAGSAHAGAWPEGTGVTQAILKYERGRSDEDFTSTGGRASAPHVADDDLSLFVEHGLTSRLTFQGQIGYTRGQVGPFESDGRGPISAGLRWTPYVGANGREVLSVYAGGVLDGEGRNSAYLLPGQGDHDGEFRVLYGRSAKVFGREGFLDVQVAYLARSAFADETHLDVTVGYEVARNWLLLLQNYDGDAMTAGRDPRWAKVEGGVVRRFGSWRVQAGWRATVAGRSTPAESGPVLAVWKTF